MEKGAIAPSCLFPHPAGSGAGVKGWGEGAAEPLVLGPPQWDRPVDPRAVSYPSCLWTSPVDHRGWAAMGAWCPWRPVCVPGSPLCLSHPRSVPQGSGVFAKTDGSLQEETFLCRFLGSRYTRMKLFQTPWNKHTSDNKLTSDLLLDFLGRVQPILQRKCFLFSIWIRKHNKHYS